MLFRSLSYRKLLIFLTINVVCLYCVDIDDMEICSNNEPTSSRIQPQSVVDRTEKRNERRRERYAQMNTESKNELIARKCATYQQKRSLAGKLFVIDDFFIATCTLAYNHLTIHVIREH